MRVHKRFLMCSSICIIKFGLHCIIFSYCQTYRQLSASSNNRTILWFTMDFSFKRVHFIHIVVWIVKLLLLDYTSNSNFRFLLNYDYLCMFLPIVPWIVINSGRQVTWVRSAHHIAQTWSEATQMALTSRAPPPAVSPLLKFSRPSVRTMQRKERVRKRNRSLLQSRLWTKIWKSRLSLPSPRRSAMGSLRSK